MRRRPPAPAARPRAGRWLTVLGAGLGAERLLEAVFSHPAVAFERPVKTALSVVTAVVPAAVAEIAAGSSPATVVATAATAAGVAHLAHEAAAAAQAVKDRNRAELMAEVSRRRAPGRASVDRSA